MVKKRLFIEGNRDLRPAFGKLLSGICPNETPQIIMGGGINQTITKFEKDTSLGQKFLLIDFADLKGLEDPSKIKWLKENENVFFMTQTMESWFLSQPEILDSHFRLKNIFVKKFKSKNPKTLSKPFDELKTTVKKHKRGFHKVRDGAKLLEKLNTEKLQKYFSETNKIDLSQICLKN